MTAPRLCLAVVILGATPLGAVGPDVDPRIATLLADVSPARLEATLEKLESFQTRHLLSATETPARGIGAARQWILDEMKSYSRASRSRSTPTASRSKATGSRARWRCA